jgi:hypothetical protein
MGTSLWKVTAKQNNSKLKSGMSAEIFLSNSSNPRRQQDICDALNQKYGTDISSGSCGVTNFNIEKLSK